ncbi:MAG: 5'-deoxyadenosine deaminase [Myxococcales bacterium]|nr:5'-deoxyadenosine deaminase [Myxococcales bacterium]
MIEVRGGTVVTMDPARRVIEGSVYIAAGRILAVGGPPPEGFRVETVVDAGGCLVAPGLVQAHVHVCQTLCRGAADDLPLLEWLRERVWPYEAALDERAMRACVRVACAELIRGGTTAILDMGTVHETDALADEIGRSGLRAVCGKAMMDHGEGVPSGLRESTRAALDESDALARRWSGSQAHGGRLGYAYAPRFVLSCSDELLDETAARCRAGARVHTHASEQVAEVALVRARFGADNIAWLDRIGLGGARVTLAHCVHVTDEERGLLAAHGTHVVHCPSSNLKLASGIAPVPELLAAGVSVALGADGAPCNNNLDAFLELRLAALLHKHRAGARAIGASTALELATLGGARALGLEAEIGSLEAGKRGDLIVVDLQAAHLVPMHDPTSTLVYAARSSDVRDVIVDGRALLRDRRLTDATGLDLPEVLARGTDEARRVASRTRLG